MHSDTLYWLWLSLRLGVASGTLLPLLDRFGTPYEIYTADEQELSAVPELSPRARTALCDKSLETSYRISDFCAKENIGILSYGAERYPARLRMLKNPPALLYYKGTMPELDSRLCIAMVGTRRMTGYGKRTSYKIAYDLAAAGAVIVSGMARGVDSVSACGALAAGGQTIAVLGSGIDVVYPAEHKKLMDVISHNGAVVSEFPPGTPPDGRNFPIRNRIISGLCQGTLIVEAGKGSGALITAKDALVQGRDLFALPGNIGEGTAHGTNSLIRDGAAIVIEANDILKAYDFLYADTIDRVKPPKSPYAALSCDEMLAQMGVESTGLSRLLHRNQAKEETPPTPKPILERPALKATGDQSEKIFETLDEAHRALFELIPLDRAISLDKLLRQGYAMNELMTMLMTLEMKGLINSLPGGLYIRR